MKKRKGFTLVELLVVIAILAVLASVSVIGYLGFTEKARRSNDEQLVANINSVLMADEVFTNSPVAAIDIVENLEQKGFKLETQSKDVDLFYNTDKGRVELASIDKEGNYQTIYPEVKKIYCSQSKNQWSRGKQSFVYYKLLRKFCSWICLSRSKISDWNFYFDQRYPQCRVYA